MPIIHVEMLTGRTAEQKKALADTLTKGFIDSCGGHPQSINVIITEVEAENWAIGGTLIADRQK